MPPPDDATPDDARPDDAPASEAAADDAGPTQDPLAEASPRRLRRLARRADRLRRRRPHALEGLAAQLGVSVRRLRLLGDAWAEGGASGVQAIGPAFPTPPGPMAEAEDALISWRSRHHPYESLRWDVWRNRVTVWRLLPDQAREDVARHPLLQLRVTHDGRWHLYHRAAQGEWWPVIVHGPGEHQDVQDCLDVVELDAGNRFWSTELDLPTALEDHPELGPD